MGDARKMNTPGRNSESSIHTERVFSVLLQEWHPRRVNFYDFSSRPGDTIFGRVSARYAPQARKMRILGDLTWQMPEKWPIWKKLDARKMGLSDQTFGEYGGVLMNIVGKTYPVRTHQLTNSYFISSP